MTARTAAILAALLLGLRLPGGAAAQEVILDPENPRAGGSAAEDRHGEAADPGIIVDPENPRAGDLVETPPDVDDSRDESVESAPAVPSGYFAGSYRGRFYFDTARDNTYEDIFLLQNRLDLRLGMRFGERWRAVVEGRLEHRLWGEGNPDGTDWFVNGEHYQGTFEPQLRDAFVTGQLGRVVLTVGQQAIVWGAGTLSQPAAVVNPVDYRDGVFDTPADQRLPVLAAVMDVVVERLTMSAVVVPFFEPHRVDVVGTDFSAERAVIQVTGGLGVPVVVPRPDDSLEPLAQDALLVTEFPEATFENAAAGARVASTYGGVDLGLGYFFGWDRLPFVAVNEQILGDLLEDLESDRPLSLALNSRYERLHTLELDAVTYLGDLGVRLESVFHPERTVYLADEAARTARLAVPRAERLPAVTTALALSWEESSAFVIQLEVLWAHVFDVPSGERLAGLDEDTWFGLFAVLFDLERIEALSGTWAGDLALRLSGLVGLNEGDAALYPSLVWSVGEAVDLALGAQLYFGPDPAEVITLGGVFDENDQGWVSVDVAF